MRTFCVLLVAVSTCLSACFLNDPYAVPRGYVRDELFCWRVDDTTGRWVVQGHSHECPPNTPTGYPSSVMVTPR